jgi:hypothetical protein
MRRYLTFSYQTGICGMAQIAAKVPWIPTGGLGKLDLGGVCLYLWIAHNGGCLILSVIVHTE